MTQLLVSVTSMHEAMLAIDAGADIIDLKDPVQGSLGALPLPIINEVMLAIKGIRQTSATVGDLPMEPELLVNAIARTAQTGIDYIKIGFFDEGDHEACLNALRPLALNRLKLIAVLFADHHPNMRILPKLQTSGFCGVMLDTLAKDGLGLLDYMSLADLHLFIKNAKSCSLFCGLAGSLRIADVPLLLPLKPGYLGFRGALCVDLNRKFKISELKLKELRNMLHKNNTCSTDWASSQVA